MTDRAAGPDDTPAASLVKPLILLALIVAFVLTVYVSPLHELLLPEGQETLRERIAALGFWAPVAYMALSAFAISVGAPRLAFSILGGVLFNWHLGFLYAHIGTVLGCLGAFSWARWLGRDYVTARGARRRGRLREKVKQHPIATNILIRVCPVGNNFATNVLFGISPVTTKQFFIGTFIGTSPETLIYAVFGSSAEDASELKLLLGAGMLAVMTVGFWVASRRSKMAADVRNEAEGLAEDPEDADEHADEDADQGDEAPDDSESERSGSAPPASGPADDEARADRK
ncbi:MAG: TVP38/TMEM64 family protein [Planctomycetota bacterium]|jgi:uncharacterized membrane protein YdjX (TVP38/TMEM64 family)